MTGDADPNIVNVVEQKIVDVFSCYSAAGPTPPTSNACYFALLGGAIEALAKLAAFRSVEVGQVNYDALADALTDKFVASARQAQGRLEALVDLRSSNPLPN